MKAVAAPPPVPGEVIDPPPKEVPEAVEKLDAKDGAAATVAGVGYRAMTRFSFSTAGLLAAGTTYYLFLAMFSVLAFAYGIVAIVGADSLADWLTDSLSEQFPGLVGDSGIDPDRLEAVGRATSIVGLVALVWAGGGAMSAANDSLHQIFGAPPDPRSFVRLKGRLLGWMLLLLPVVGLSYAASAVVASSAGPVLDRMGLESTAGRVGLAVLTLVGSYVLDFVVLFLLLSHFGGIRPERRARLVGAAVGAVVIQVLKLAMGLLVGLSTDKPQYGALALPIGILLVLYLQTIAAYGSAALTAGIAERDVPLEELTPDAAEPVPESGG
jgi:membrane protein